jgi:osmotically-inducible protein OsmY
MSTNPSPAGERLSFVRAQLLQAVGRDPMLTPSSLQLTIDDDTMLIGGMVPHAAAKQRISDLAHQLAPDLTIDNSCVVDAMAVPSNSELANRAGDWVQRTFGDDASTMGVLIANGTAHLRGTWPTIAAVRQAKEVIGQFPGIAKVDVASVTLRHDVRLPEGETMPLDEIGLVNQLEANMAASGWRLGDWVDARSDHGRLTLVGVVDDDDCRKRVVEIASHLQGVRRVKDDLITRSGSTSRDQAVEQRIRGAWAKANVGTPDLSVFVTGGQAFVGGTVDTPESKEQALHLVRREPGIRQVFDYIRIVTRRSRPA